MNQFTDYQYALILDALEKRKIAFMVGDKMFNDYQEIINVIQTKKMTASDWE